MRFELPALACSVVLLATALPLHAQSTLRAAPSTRATTEVALSYPANQAPAGAGPATIRLDYGQPHLRGRAINTDSLVPFDKPWRTGANDPTTLTTGVDLVIGGQAVPKGTYILWSLPTRNSWHLVVQRAAAGAAMQQAMRYDPANDVARVPLTRTTLATPVEALTMWLIPATATTAPARGELRLAWGNAQLSTDWVVR